MRKLFIFAIFLCNWELRKYCQNGVCESLNRQSKEVTKPSLAASLEANAGNLIAGNLIQRNFRSSQMYKYFIYFVAACCCCIIMVGCSQWSEEEERFVRTYTEILIVREQFPDTALANARVANVLQRNGFTEQTFRLYFQHLSNKPERLLRIMDSSRALARRIAEEEQRKEEKQRKTDDKMQQKHRQEQEATRTSTTATTTTAAITTFAGVTAEKAR